MQKAQLLLYHLEVEKRHVQLDTLWILYMYGQTNQAKNKQWNMDVKLDNGILNKASWAAITLQRCNVACRWAGAAMHVGWGSSIEGRYSNLGR